MEIEKNISIFIEQQFPGIYKEEGAELVQLVKDYYTFLETQSNQSTYVSRRMFEYRDIDTTLSRMVIFFKKKFLADLPLKENIVTFIVKNILDLYRRKGTPAGIELFFAIFYQEFDVEIVYPAEKMLKISNSIWRQGTYLQLFPNTNVFLSKTEKQYSYKDLISKNITGSASGAKAAVSRVNWMLLNGTKTPIVYIDSVQGNFERYDNIFTNINGEVVEFGVVNGSLSEFLVDDDGTVTAGNRVGDVLDVVSEYGEGGKAIVTSISNQLSGQINYTLVNGGYGYSVENTRLLVSNQTLILENPSQDFVVYERLEDGLGNQGIVIGQSVTSLGVRMNSGQAFSFGTPISTLDRFDEDGNDINITFFPVGVVPKNESSPGLLYPDTGSTTDVIVGSLTNTSTASLITDLVAPFLGVSINAADYETAAPMSGPASPVNLLTPLNQAFDIQDITIGRIGRFDNVSPGSLYQNQVWAVAEDDVIKPLDRRNQLIRLTDPGAAGVFSVGETIVEVTSNIEGIITEVNTEFGFLSVTPFDYYGFSGDYDIRRSNGDEFGVIGVDVDYNSRPFGDNATIDSDTEFAIGRIQTVAIYNSGFGYVDGLEATLVNSSSDPRASGTIRSLTQGRTSGYWASYSSHLNGFELDPYDDETPILPTQEFVTQVSRVAVGLTASPLELDAWLTTTASDGFAYGDINMNGSIQSSDSLQFLKLAVGASDVLEASVTRWNTIIAPSLRTQPWFETYSSIWRYVNQYTYYASGQKIQDSDFYQEYSYQIRSTLSKGEYEKLLKQNVHLAGTKMFGDFIYKVEIPQETKARFVRFFNDDGRGSPLDLADVNLLEASVTNFTADSTFVTADHEPTP